MDGLDLSLLDAHDCDERIDAMRRIKATPGVDEYIAALEARKREIECDELARAIGDLLEATITYEQAAHCAKLALSYRDLEGK